MSPEELFKSANRVARAKVHRAGLLKIIRENEERERMDKDTERDLLCEMDAIELADEILRLRSKLEDVEYEYGVMQTRSSSGEDLVDRMVWGTLKEAQEDMGIVSGSSGAFWKYRIVKRRKAGEIEDA